MGGAWGLEWDGMGYPEDPKGSGKCYSVSNETIVRKIKHLPDLQSAVCHNTRTSASSGRIFDKDFPEVRLSLLKLSLRVQITGNG